MKLHGSTISFPFRADQTGGFVTTADRKEIIAAAIADIVETRRGERVMLPQYGLPDYAFAVANASFGHRIAYMLEEQIKAYVPLVRDVVVTTGVDDEGRVTVEVRYREVGSVNAPGNLVFPVWRYRDVAA